MFSNLGATELIIIAVVIILLFGAKKMPDMARSLGRSMRIIKAETKGMREDDQTQAASATPAATATPAPGATPVPAQLPEAKPAAEPQVEKMQQQINDLQKQLKDTQAQKNAS